MEQQTKAMLRNHYRMIRKGISDNYAKASAEIISIECIKLLTNHSIIALYSAIDSEIDVSTLAQSLMNFKKIILKPSNNSLYEFWECNSSKKLSPDALVIPLISFDAKMNRLGFGKGWYDRALSKIDSKALKIGVAYEAQYSPTPLPIEPHDKQLDIIITEKAIRTYGGVSALNSPLPTKI